MAADSRDKRASIFGLGLAALSILPSPGALDAGDRRQLAYCYRLAAAEPIDFMCAHMAGRSPSITFAGRSPSVTFTPLTCGD